MLWDIFCKVIDNHGDLGVCWRLAAQLAARREQVRLWVDDASALVWMAPQASSLVEVLPWTDSPVEQDPGDVVIEAFGCELPPAFQKRIAKRAPQPVWINLEYLTAESFAARNHRLASPVLAGPGAGATKYFFYPGFTQDTGGLMREPLLSETQQHFDSKAWLQAHGVEDDDGLVASLFCYEPEALTALLEQLALNTKRTNLLVTGGRPAAATRSAIEALDHSTAGWNSQGKLAVHYLPLLTQPDFDQLLWSCDLNFVRGEDSLVRALWAGRPFIWHIYPQHDDAHHDKLRAFLDWLDAPESLRKFHLAWNGIEGELPRLELDEWRDCANDARLRLLAQDDLVSQLMQFVESKRGAA